ncbi:AAA family ATPase [Georgenia sp. TF02-10]|uniref:AAA family ATPase n=1 Tax=Georgenia sp. TF02-10 TaxID=2917725 RepID=UPI001FA6ACF6|nr:AAA family ATPase [Georgenia sp. TF02-10]UNX53961.1 AAA family ATPase [Georgenia sp. TF02-10]
MSADILILTGPPGSGKSRTARALASTYPRSVHLHTDDFWHVIVSGAIPPYRPESEDQNHTVMRVIQRAAAAYAAGGFVTVVDGVVGPWMLDHFRRAAGEDAARLHYVVLRPSREEALRRAQHRTGPDALVDEEPILSLWDQFSDLGRLERHVIDSTHQEPAETLRCVQEAVASNAFVLEAGPRG